MPGATAADLLPPVIMSRNRVSLPLAMSAAMLIMVAVTAATVMTSAALRERAQVVRLTEASLVAERLLSDLTDAETGQRGFLLTGQERYLNPYHAALPRVADDLARLQELTEPYGVMGTPVATLSDLVPAKLAELVRTIEMRRAGDAAGAVELLETDQGVSLMSRARTQVRQIGELAGQSRAASDAAVERWLWIGTLSALALFAGGVWLLLRLRRERAMSRRALIESELSFRAALDAIPQIVWSAQPDGVQDYANHRLTASAREQGGHWSRQIHPDDRDRAEQAWHAAVDAGTPFAAEHRLRAADGSYAWTLNRAMPVRDAVSGKVTRWYGTCTDIDELVQARSALTAALEARETLLHEVNHRVKNSLQLVSSLLTLQASRAASPELRETLRDARARLSVVARLHQRLYQEGTHASIDLPPFIHDLCRESLAAIGTEPHTRLVFQALGGDSYLLPIERAVPIALVVSELLTNAVKHAFAEQGGTLFVSVERDGAALRIEVADDGPGLPPGFELAAAHGVGMRVVTALVRQLGGDIEAGRGHAGAGAVFRLVVPVEPY